MSYYTLMIATGIQRYYVNAVHAYVTFRLPQSKARRPDFAHLPPSMYCEQRIYKLFVQRSTF